MCPFYIESFSNADYSSRTCFPFALQITYLLLRAYICAYINHYWVNEKRTRKREKKNESKIQTLIVHYGARATNFVAFFLTKIKFNNFILKFIFSLLLLSFYEVLLKRFMSIKFNLFNLNASNYREKKIYILVSVCIVYYIQRTNVFFQFSMCKCVRLCMSTSQLAHCIIFYFNFFFVLSDVPSCRCYFFFFFLFFQKNIVFCMYIWYIHTYYTREYMYRHRKNKNREEQMK